MKDKLIVDERMREFSKDILHLSYLCEYYGLQEVADYWASVVHINEWQIDLTC